MRLLTRGSGGRILTNANVWSPDGEWIVYDIRSDAAGTLFDGVRIERVHSRTGEIRTIFESGNGACCGVATWHPAQFRIACILGPEHPTDSYSYGPSRRQGIIVDVLTGDRSNIDARSLVPPHAAGALHGGSHVHIWHPHGDWMSFTYDDDLKPTGRNIAIAKPLPVIVNRDHPRNHDGEYHCTLAAPISLQPRLGSDDLVKACEEAWLGESRKLAFQGTVLANDGTPIIEVFLTDGRTVARISHTHDRKYPGIQGPRHWLRSSPDGHRIAFLLKDDEGRPQLWTVSPRGETRQLTNCAGIESAFTWSPCGEWLAAVVAGRVARIDSRTGHLRFLESIAPRPEACVISPDGREVAFVARIAEVNQIAVTSAE